QINRRESIRARVVGHHEVQMGIRLLPRVIEDRDKPSPNFLLGVWVGSSFAVGSAESSAVALAFLKTFLITRFSRGRPAWIRANGILDAAPEAVDEIIVPILESSKCSNDSACDHITLLSGVTIDFGVTDRVAGQ